MQYSSDHADIWEVYSISYAEYDGVKIIAAEICWIDRISLNKNDVK